MMTVTTTIDTTITTTTISKVRVKRRKSLHPPQPQKAPSLSQQSANRLTRSVTLLGRSIVPLGGQFSNRQGQSPSATCWLGIWEHMAAWRHRDSLIHPLKRLCRTSRSVYLFIFHWRREKEGGEGKRKCYHFRLCEWRPPNWYPGFHKYRIQHHQQWEAKTIVGRPFDPFGQQQFYP